MVRKIIKISSLLQLKAISILRRHEAYARRIGVKVGSACRIYNCQFGSEPFLITIGDRVTVTSGVRFLTHDGSLCLVRDEKGRRYRYNEILVGDDVFIGLFVDFYGEPRPASASAAGCKLPMVSLRRGQRFEAGSPMIAWFMPFGASQSEGLKMGFRGLGARLQAFPEAS